MSVALAVLIVAIVAALATATWSMVHHGAGDPLDPAAEERWLVERVRHRPRLAAFVRRRLDSSTAGGLLLTILFLVVFGTAFLFGVVLDLVDSNSTAAEIDRSISEWGSRHADSRAVDILEFVTELGGSMVLIVTMVVIALVDYWRRRNISVLLFVLTVGLGQTALSNLLKQIVDRERPAVLRLTGASGPSFPSGHSTAAAACWAAIALVLVRTSPREVRAVGAALAVLIAAAVGASRALLGVHWLTDVIAGLILGWGWFTVVAIAFGGRLMRLGEPAERIGSRQAPLTAAPGSTRSPPRR